MELKSPEVERLSIFILLSRTADQRENMEQNHIGRSFWSHCFVMLVDIRIRLLILHLLNISSAGDFFKTNFMAFKSDVSCEMVDVYCIRRCVLGICQIRQSILKWDLN